MLVKLIDHEVEDIVIIITHLIHFFKVNEHFSLNFLRKTNLFALNLES